MTNRLKVRRARPLARLAPAAATAWLRANLGLRGDMDEDDVVYSFIDVDGLADYCECCGVLSNERPVFEIGHVVKNEQEREAAICSECLALFIRMRDNVYNAVFAQEAQ